METMCILFLICEFGHIRFHLGAFVRIMNFNSVAFWGLGKDFVLGIFNPSTYCGFEVVE